MAPTKLTARMSTGGGSPLKKVTKNIRKSAPAMKIHVNQLKEESEHRQAVIIVSHPVQVLKVVFNKNISCF